MARQTADYVPHLPDLIASVAECWRAIRDAQSEVNPFGTNYAALDEARAGLERLAHRLTGQHGFLRLAPVAHPRRDTPLDAAPF